MINTKLIFNDCPICHNKMDIEHNNIGSNMSGYYYDYCYKCRLIAYNYSSENNGEDYFYEKSFWSKKDFLKYLKLKVFK